jgi:AraC-like DNA-binding protein
VLSGNATLPGERWLATHDEAGGSSQNRADMLERYGNFIAEIIGRHSIQAAPEKVFRVIAHARCEAGFTIARFATVGGFARFERNSAEIRADEGACYAFCLPLRSGQQVKQRNRTVDCSPGSLTVGLMTEPSVHTKRGDNDTIYFAVPTAHVNRRLIHAEDMCARLVDVRTGVGRLAADTITALHREAFRISTDEFLGAAYAASDLLTLAVADLTELTSNENSIRGANLARAKRVIRARFADEDLSPSDIALECGLSVRYLHDLFRDDGRTVREYLHRERLKAARSMLERSEPGLATVTYISLACGFATHSQFSTAFRQAYGLSPRDVLRRR